MSTALLEDLLVSVSSEQRAAFRADYLAIGGLPQAKGHLQRFLDDYLQHLVRLYAATGGSIWFVSPTRDLAPKARVGYDELGLDGDLEVAHEKLLRYALTRPRSFLVKPYSAPARNAGVSNPTDSFLVLGPVDHHGERIAVVELYLGPTPVRGQTAAERNRYVLWLDHLLTFLCQGIEVRLLRTAAPLPVALEQLSVVQAEIESLQATIRDTLQARLQVFAGWNFGSLQQNQAFAGRLHELLDQYGLRVECTQCGAPAILRCQNSGNSRTGVFLFDHYLTSGRTFHGGPTTVPVIQLVSKPARRKPT